MLRPSDVVKLSLSKAILCSSMILFAFPIAFCAIALVATSALVIMKYVQDGKTEIWTLQVGVFLVESATFLLIAEALLLLFKLLAQRIVGGIPLLSILTVQFLGIFLLVLVRVRLFSRRLLIF
jgi:hypothetical protein